MYLSEMAMERSDAIGKCVELGNEFIEHFIKVADEGPYNRDFEYHCKEMQTWWNLVTDIQLKYNKKLISNSQLMDWFFSRGSSIEYIIPTKYQDAYEEFCINLLKNKNKSIIDAIKELEIEYKEIYQNKWS